MTQFGLPYAILIVFYKRSDFPAKIVIHFIKICTFRALLFKSSQTDFKRSIKCVPQILWKMIFSHKYRNSVWKSFLFGVGYAAKILYEILALKNQWVLTYSQNDFLEFLTSIFSSQSRHQRGSRACSDVCLCQINLT